MSREDRIEGLIIESTNDKWRAQAMCNALKSGKFNKCLNAAYSMAGEHVDVYCFVSGATLYANVYVQDLTGFKDERLAGILTQVEYLKPDTTSMEEYPAQMRKNFAYEFMLPPSDRNIVLRCRLEVSATIKEESETCRRVVVGMTEAVAKPIYKLVCDDEPVEAPQ